MNFGKPVHGLPLCRCAWCGTCYRADPGDDFLIYFETDEDRNDLVALDEELDFLKARPGNHLFCPFECKFCAFHLLKGRPPIKGDRSDDLFFKYARWGNLDAFWSRQPGTI